MSASALMPSVQEGCITQLPGEVLINIFSYLSTYDRICCIHVCKAWGINGLACEPLWHQLAITADADQHIPFQVASLARHLLIIAQTRRALWRTTRLLSAPETTPFAGLRRFALFIHEAMDKAAVHALSEALKCMGKQLEAVEVGYFESAGSATLENLVLAPCTRVTQVAYSIYGDEVFMATRPRDHMLVTTRMLTDLRIQTDAQMTADHIRMVLLAAPCLRQLSLNVCEYDALAVIADHSSLIHLDFNYYNNTVKADTTWHQQQQQQQTVSPPLSPSASSTNERGLKVVRLGWVSLNAIDLVVSLLIRHRSTLEELAIKERLGNRNWDSRLSDAWKQLLSGAGQPPIPELLFPRLATATLGVSWDTQVLTRMLSRCPALVSLSMAHMCFIQGPPLFETLLTMPCLEHLVIDTCMAITSGLEDYFKLQPRLRNIGLYGEIPALTDGALSALGSLASLSCLALGEMESAVGLNAWVTSMGTLDELSLSNLISVDDALLLKLKDHMRKLYLNMLWSVTDRGIVSFIDQAAFTQELHISLCPAISKEAIRATTSKMHIFIKE
ncbi:hypothetical protein BX666DRAFT_2022466 [Dichotomocladium elegans]|nr:hypothetical protein BX666DRAFT_2022466 [Dichotomocladium elegans]